MKRLDNKVAIITGGSGGIGLETAKKFLAEGAKVALVDLKQESLEAAQKELNAGDRVIVIQGDVTSAEDTQNFVKKTLDAFGKLNIMFANAGIEGSVAPIIDFDDKMFDTVMAVNIKGVYLSIKHSIAAIRDAGGGSIIVSSSVTGLRGVPNAVAYSTSKHATVGLTKSAAMDLAKYKIRVNAINPSPVDGRMMESLEEGFAPGQAEAAHERLLSQIPLRRYAEPSEIADLALFLASDESKFITGTTNPIDGGMLA